MTEKIASVPTVNLGGKALFQILYALEGLGWKRTDVKGYDASCMMIHGDFSSAEYWHQSMRGESAHRDQLRYNGNELHRICQKDGEQVISSYSKPATKVNLE